jgi:hypothetical protein
MTFKCVNRLFTLIIYYKLLEVPSYETQSYCNSPFVKESRDSNGSKSSYGPVLHSYIWTPYSTLLNCNIYIEITSVARIRVTRWPRHLQFTQTWYDWQTTCSRNLSWWSITGQETLRLFIKPESSLSYPQSPQLSPSMSQLNSVT